MSISLPSPKPMLSKTEKSWLVFGEKPNGEPLNEQHEYQMMRNISRKLEAMMADIPVIRQSGKFDLELRFLEKSLDELRELVRDDANAPMSLAEDIGVSQEELEASFADL